jgi:hypothetical protein
LSIEILEISHIFPAKRQKKKVPGKIRELSEGKLKIKP